MGALPSVQRTRGATPEFIPSGEFDEAPGTYRRLITPGPESNGHSPYATGRGHFKRSWFIVAVAVAALIILGVVVHW